MNKQRKITKIIDAKTTTEGEGFTVHRAFPNQDIREFDPFLLLDEWVQLIYPQARQKERLIILHLSMKPGSKFIQEIPLDYNAFTYVIRGKGLFGEEKKFAKNEQAVFFERNGNPILIFSSEDSEDSLEILLFGGPPIGDPKVRYGPFVMNTEKEIQQAIEDYRNGRMGKIDF